MALARELTAKIYEIRAHNGNVTCLDLGETGSVLVTGGHDCNVNLWAIGQTERFMSLTGHRRPIVCVRFAYNDNYVYSADDIGMIRRWDLNAQTICSTLNGHMKSVRTLDFNPSGEYVVSGSCDTTVRLWDVRNQNQCIKIYRGHISHVNSVKFSPDGLWIASAGSEGSVLIWDIRKSKQIMDFTEKPPGPAITCIQFHPFEFLLAVGRIDGTICIYDLEKQVCILQTNPNSPFYGHPIKCITFSENGNCLFVGSAAGISVIGWEPHKEFDHIKPAWTNLHDMKVVKGKLICGSSEDEFVSINALSVSRVFPFYNPSNQERAFIHNSTTRKSFSRGNQKLRLSIAGNKTARLPEENEESKSPSLDEQSSPNLSLELVDETSKDYNASPPPTTRMPIYPNNGHGNGFFPADNYNGDFHMTPNDTQKLTDVSYNFASIASSTGYSSLNYDGPSSLKMPGERDIYVFQNNMHTYEHPSDLEFNLNDSNPPIITNYDHTEMVEDFPVNQNIAPQPNGVGTMGLTAKSVNATRSIKANSTSHVQKRGTIVGMGAKGSTSVGVQHHQRSKLSHVSSVSTTELHKMDDNMLLKKSASSQVVNRGRGRANDTQAHLNKENARNKNFTVQIITKAPTRSRTSLELRTSPSQMSSGQPKSTAHQRLAGYSNDTTSMGNSSNIPVSYRPDPALLTSMNPRSVNGRGADDSMEIEMLSAAHEQVYQELSNRHAALQLIRNSTRAHDIVGALKQALKLSGRTVFVDLLGAIIEKTSSWNLDLCMLLLPEIYELLQSQHKFHYTRACDTLRVILSNFLPIIQENIDPWAASGLGVDVTREERQRKCIECQRWLLQIRNLPESSHFGTTLTQLQNLIVNI